MFHQTFEMSNYSKTTDFAAKDSKFKEFTNDISDHLANNFVTDISELAEKFEEKRVCFSYYFLQ